MKPLINGFEPLSKKKVLVLKSNRKVCEIAAQFCGLQKTSRLAVFKISCFHGFLYIFSHFLLAFDAL